MLHYPLIFSFTTVLNIDVTKILQHNITVLIKFEKLNVSIMTIHVLSTTVGKELSCVVFVYTQRQSTVERTYIYTNDAVFAEAKKNGRNACV